MSPLGSGLGFLAALALVRERAQGVSDWLTWRTRIGLQYALLEATAGKLHNMPLRIQRSEGVGAFMIRLDCSIQGLIGAVTQILFGILPSLLERWAKIHSRFNEVLSGILIVRSFTMEEAEKSRLLRDVSDANTLVIRRVATDMALRAISSSPRHASPRSPSVVTSSSLMPSPLVR